MTTHISPNIRFVQHTSEVLRGNPLGDRHVRDFPIWVPPDHDSSRDKRYPVIFGLTGFTGRGVNYLNRRFMFPAHDELLDELERLDELEDDVNLLVLDDELLE